MCLFSFASTSLSSLRSVKRQESWGGASLVCCPQIEREKGKREKHTREEEEEGGGDDDQE